MKFLTVIFIAIGIFAIARQFQFTILMFKDYGTYRMKYLKTTRNTLLYFAILFILITL